MRVVEIHITAVVPDGEEELGHEAIFLARDAVLALAQHLREARLTDVQHSRRLLTSRGTQKLTTTPAV